MGITQITTPVPTRGTKEPWRSDSKGQEDTASTSGHVGRIIATTEGPKGAGFVHWLGFSIEQEAKITWPKQQEAPPSLEVTWPGSYNETIPDQG